jgi:hypothetical protein
VLLFEQLPRDIGPLPHPRLECIGGIDHATHATPRSAEPILPQPSSLLSPLRSFGMEQMLTIARAHASHPRSSSTRSLWIGILNQLFYERRYIASAPSLSSTAELSKSCGLVGVLDGRVGGGAEIAGARGGRSGRSVELRASGASACVGRRFSASQIVWNRSPRRAGARSRTRVGRPRCLRILTITGGSSIATMTFKAPARRSR